MSNENSLERAHQAMRQNNNLDLVHYDQYLKEFQSYSENLFDPSENIFVDRKK